MATVIQTLLYFFDIYPEAYVLFSGSTPERTRLYQIIIARELTYAAATFSFWGMDEDGVLHPFAKNKLYISDYDEINIRLAHARGRMERMKVLKLCKAQATTMTVSLNSVL